MDFRGGGGGGICGFWLLFFKSSIVVAVKRVHTFGVVLFFFLLRGGVKGAGVDTFYVNVLGPPRMDMGLFQCLQDIGARQTKTRYVIWQLLFQP